MKLGLMVFAIYASTPCLSQGKPRQYLAPTLVTSNTNDHVVVTYELPCDAELKGIIVRPQGDSLEVGALIEAGKASCAAMNQFKVTTLPQLIRSSFKSIYALNPQDYYGKPNLRPFIQLQKTENEQQQGLIQGIYQSRCGSPVGIVFSPKGHINFLEMRAPNVEQACQATQEMIELAGLHLRDRQLLRLRIQDSNENFKLIATSIRKNSLRHSKSRLSFYYLRQCNEAPVGPMIYSKAGHMFVQMIVAQYPFVQCAENTPRYVWSPITFTRFSLSANKKWRAVTRRSQQSYSAIAPYHIERAAGTTSAEAFARIFTMGGCSQISGYLALERTGAVYLSALIPSTDKISRCQTALKSVSYDLEGFRIPQNSSISALNLGSGTSERYSHLH